MIKKALGILAVATIMFSCGNKTEKTEAVNENEVVTISVDQLMGDLKSHVDKEVVIGGLVNHVCKHGGKRMFIIGQDPDVAIKITPNDEIGVFEQELVGSTVLVTGIVKELRINEEYVVSLESETVEVSKSEALHDHSGGTHDEEADDEADAEKKAQLDAMRVQIAESENGYYSQYWIEAVKFEVKESDHEHAEGEEHEHAEADTEDHGHEHAEGEGHDEDHGHEHAEGEEGHTH